MNTTGQTNIRVASFFAGIGGFDLAFENSGCEVVFQCEVNPFCQQVLKNHWPGVRLAENICNVKAEEIPEADVWCGGFPCQDLSLANQGKRQGLEGERSGLFAEFAALAAIARPKWIVLENVPGLLNSRDGQDFRDVLQALDDIGYFVAWRVFDAKHFGTPQRRRRVFIVASYQNDSAARVLFEDGPSEEMAFEGATQNSGIARKLGSRIQNSNLFAIQHATIGRKPEAGPQAKGYRNDGETYTLDSRGSTDVVCSTVTGFRVRRTSRVPGELDSRRVRAIGNAVCVHVAQWVAQRLVAVENEDLSSLERQPEYASFGR